MARIRTYSPVKALRPSVISVVAAFGALGGCDDGPEYSVNPPSCLDASASGCVPSVCDDAAPTEGSACEEEGATCAYEDEYCDPSTLEATCRGGRWELVYPSCNPPEPTLTEDCPIDTPVNATPCAVSEDEQCSYGDCFGSPVFEATCENQVWRVSELSCNPPEPECPSEQPTAGADCGLVTAEVCLYGNCSGERPIQAECTASGWRIVEISSNPPASGCPEEQPKQDAACTYLGDGCGYKDGSDPAHVLAKCVEGEWDLIVEVCN